MQLSYTQLRQNLKKTIDDTIDTHDEIIITSHQKPKAVLISYDDFCSLKETSYLLKSPANARRLLTAVEDIRAKKKKVKVRKLLDDKA